MDGLKVERHQGKRFTATPLALAKVFHGLRVLGITDQVEAPQAFYSQDFPFSQGFTGSLDCIFSFRQLLPTFLVPNLWTANRAGNRLGMGAGYYDRFLARAIHAKTAGVIWDVQLVSAVIREDHDVPVQYVITEQQILLCKRGKI